MQLSWLGVHDCSLITGFLPVPSHALEKIPPLRIEPGASRPSGSLNWHIVEVERKASPHRFSRASCRIPLDITKLTALYGIFEALVPTTELVA
jgi:hypothetical protein